MVYIKLEKFAEITAESNNINKKKLIKSLKETLNAKIMEQRAWVVVHRYGLQEVPSPDCIGALVVQPARRIAIMIMKSIKQIVSR